MNYSIWRLVVTNKGGKIMTEDNSKKYEPKWINKMCKQEQKVEITFLDGEVLWGKIKNVGKYELDFECNGVTLMVFKHSIKYIQYER